MSDSNDNIVAKQRAEIERLEGAIIAMRSEIYYATTGNKSDEVRRHYLENAMRYADRAIYIT